MKLLRLLALAVIVINSAFALANNPTPFVNQPLIPASVAPGGAGFTLTVNGTGFVSGSTVNWNGSARATTFVNASQLTATILSTDVVTASTASVTVASPSPGGGTSNVVFLPVREPAGFVSLNASNINTPAMTFGLAVGDFDNDGNQDIVAGLSDNSTSGIAIWLGNGDGTFRKGKEYSVPQLSGLFVVTTDLNQDGKSDLIAFGAANIFFIFLGRGDGSFRMQQPESLPESPTQAAVGDFNRDGANDVVFLTNNGFCVALGNGDGSFAPGICTDTDHGHPQTGLAVGDFDLDGNLDLVLGSGGIKGLTVVLGNGDGTFKAAQKYSIAEVDSIATADLNGDGKLDLAILPGARILFGNGDGTFTQSAKAPAAPSASLIMTADLNGDGKVDLVTADNGFDAVAVSTFLGNGDGSFQERTDFGGIRAGGLAIADFNGDGELDTAISGSTQQALVVSTQDSGTVVQLSPNKIKFPTELVDNVSDPKIVRLANTGSSSIKISRVETDVNFSQLNNCHTIQPGEFCKIAIFFTPTQSGDAVGYLTVSDSGGGSPQRVGLAGTGTVVAFSPTQLDFGNLQVGKFSTPEKVTLTNEGTGTLSITGITIGGDNAPDFSQVNACPGQLTAGASCTITVIFHPQAQGLRIGSVEVNDNGGGSPQKVPLTGTGT